MAPAGLVGLLTRERFLRRLKYFIIGAGLIAAAVLLSACAGTARGVRSSVYASDESLSLIDRSHSSADALVVIRYPAVVAEDAEAAWYRAFSQHPIGGRFKSDPTTARQSDEVAQAIVAKSNYFAMTLYRELSRRLPKDSVLLSPHIIELDDRQRLTSRPLLASEQIPAVLTIDFSVYSFPDPEKMMDAPPLTFGDIVTPLFVVHGDRWLQPATNGLLLATQPLLLAAWAQSEGRVRGQRASRLEDTVPPPSPLALVELMDGQSVAGPDIPTRGAGDSRRGVLAVELHPLEKIRMDGEVLTRLADDHSVDPFAESFVKGAATRVVSVLNRLDHDRATFFGRRAALARFDPELARTWLARPADEAVRARMQMAEALLRAERSFLSAQSAKLYEGGYEGRYGDQMRQMLAGEYELLEKRRQMARSQNLSVALAALTMAGAVYAGSDSDSGNFFHSNTAGNLMMLSSLWAANSAMRLHAESKTVGENFLAQMAPAIDSEISVQVEWLESRQQITARDFSEFRRKTLALYQGSVRSVPAADQSGCVFRHPALAGSGRWYGGCDNGLASATGYGVFTDDTGDAIEYLGAARNGVANGIGAMIFHAAGQPGADYYEGLFSDGLPDGVVWLETPGRKPRIREFQAGRDRGGADAERLQRMQF